jgi:hypothetical protein
MSTAHKLVFECAHVDEDYRTDRVVRFAIVVSGRLPVSSAHKAVLLRACVACFEHRFGALEALLRTALAALPFVDPTHRAGLAREGERLAELFPRGRR